MKYIGVNLMDKVDELCVNARVYSFWEENQIMETLNKFMTSIKKGEAGILWPNSKSARVLYDLFPEKLVLDDGDQAIVNRNFRRKYKYLIVPTYRIKIRRMLRQVCLSCINRCKVVDIYTLFERNGLECKEDFEQLMGLGVTYSEIVKDLNENTEEQNIKTKKLIGKYLRIRDFKNAFKYISKLESLQDSEYDKYVNLQKEIESVLSEMGKKINVRNHIIVNWIDALRYDEVKNMSFLKEQSELGLYFENMYDSTPYTTATMRTVFTGGLLIEDKLYMMKMEDFAETELYKTLKNANYQFSYFGAHFKKGIFTNERMRRICALNGYGQMEVPSSLLQYELINFLSKAENNYFVIVHNLIETHVPYMNPVDKHVNYIREEDIFRIQENGSEEMARQIIRSQKYLDEQLRYYYAYYCDVAYNIFMSDHGQYRREKPVCFKGMNHTCFLILGKDILPQKYFRVTSLLAFPEMIKGLFQNKGNEVAEVYKKDYVLIQEDDMYGAKRETLLAENPSKAKICYMQHRGIITDKDFYLRYFTGEEYYVLSNCNENVIECEEYMERINYLKKLVGNQYIDFEKVSKYHIAEEVYKKLGYRKDVNLEFVE